MEQETNKKIQDLEEEIRDIRNILSHIIKTERLTFEKTLQILDGRNIEIGKGNGTKIGTETTQKLGFYGSTPISQPVATGEANGVNVGTGITLTHTATFTGNTVGSTKAYTISDIVKNLKTLGILTN